MAGIGGRVERLLTQPARESARFPVVFDPGGESKILSDQHAPAVKSSDH